MSPTRVATLTFVNDPHRDKISKTNGVSDATIDAHDNLIWQCQVIVCD